MPLTRSNPPPPLSMDEKYLNQQLSPTTRPMDLFSVNKGPGYPLAGNWSYDSANDLFSLNPADMDPMSFDFKDLFMDPFRPSATINGFTMPAAEDTVSLSSDLDSDDQSWPKISQPLGLKTEQAEHQAPTNNTSTSTRTTSTSTATTKWSSSPEIRPREYLAPKQSTTNTNTSRPTTTTTTNPRKTRSLSQDSSQDSTHSTSSPPQTQDPQTRNAAKRAAHNIIEKRYRTNMNAKFLALEQAIAPSGSGVHKPSSRGGAGSLKKSEILTNALAYIENLQGENLALKKEVALLRGERGVLPGAGAGWRGKTRG